MTRAEPYFASSDLDAIKETLKFILKCLAYGGTPVSRGTYYRGDMIGRTWICYGKSSIVHSERIYGPDTPMLRSLYRELDRRYGDWRIVLEKYGSLIPEILNEIQDPLVRAIAEAVLSAVSGGGNIVKAIEEARAKYLVYA